MMTTDTSHQAEIQGIFSQSPSISFTIILAIEMSTEDQDAVETMIGKYGMDVKALLYTAPPGEEDFDMSHAGGEHEAFKRLAHQVADIGG